MANLSEDIRIRTTVDNSKVESELAKLPAIVRKSGTGITNEMRSAGAKAGDAFARETETRLNKSMRLIGQQFSRYFGEWGRMFGEVFQVAKDVNEILPRRRGQGSGHGGSAAGVIGADIGSDAAQMAQTYQSGKTINKTVESAFFYPNKELASKMIPTGAGNAIGGAAAAGAGIGAFGGLPGVGIGLLVGAGVGALGYLITKYAEARKTVQELGKEYQLTTEEAKAFHNLGNAIGDETSVSKYLSNLVNLLDKAKQGSKEAADALKELGVASGFVSTGQANEQVVQAMKNASTQLERDVIALKAGMSLDLADKSLKANPNWNRNVQEMDYVGSSKFMGPVNRTLQGPDYDANTRKLLAEKIIADEKKNADGLKEQSKAAEELAKLYRDSVTDADEMVDLIKYDIESIKRKIAITDDIVEYSKLGLELEKKKYELQKAELASTEKFVQMMDEENERILSAQEKKAADAEFANMIDEENKAIAKTQKYLIDREQLNATAYARTNDNAGLRAFSQTDENGVTRPYSAGKLWDGKTKAYLNPTAAMQAHMDRLRGVQASRNQSEINPVTLVEIISRNGGALPVKNIIQ